MGILKGIATSILSFILFLSLTVFSIAFMLHGTVLGPDFVSTQVDKVPISSIARDLSDELVGEQLSQEMPFLNDVALNVLEKQEPWIKKEIKAAVNTGYDYFLGKTDDLNVVIPLTELKQNLKDTLWDETKLYLKKQCTGVSEAEISSYLQNIIHQIPKDILPPELSLLPSSQLNNNIEQYLRESAGLNLKQPVDPQYQLYKTLINQYVDKYLKDFIDEVPNTYTIDESTIGRQTMDAFSKVRTGIGYFQTYYSWLIVLMIVLAALIFVVNMNIKATARSLGISLTIFGVLDLAGIIIAKALPVFQIASDTFKVDIPVSLKTWLEGLINDVTSIAMPLTIGILVAGVALLVVSFIIPKKGAEA